MSEITSLAETASVLKDLRSAISGSQTSVDTLIISMAAESYTDRGMDPKEWIARDKKGHGQPPCRGDAPPGHPRQGEQPCPPGHAQLQDGGEAGARAHRPACSRAPDRRHRSSRHSVTPASQRQSQPSGWLFLYTSLSLQLFFIACATHRR